MLTFAITLSEKVYLHEGESPPESTHVEVGPRGGRYFVPSERRAKVYRVGGTVRDELMGLKPKDIDYAVESGSFGEMRDMILGLGGKIFQEREQFGCIRATIPGLGPADYTLCRKDGFYADGRHPESVSTGTILDDLARRDFTVNAIAVDAETGDVVDPHGGRADLEAKVLRAVGDPRDRLREDSLRALRALRFSAVKGLVMAPNLREAMVDKQVISSMAKLPAERVLNEMDSMLKGAGAASAFRTLAQFPAIQEVVMNKVSFKPTLESTYMKGIG